VNYDPLTSFEPICYLASLPQVVVVNGRSPYRTFADLLNAARAKPGALTLAAFGPASTPQIAFEMLKRAFNIDMTFVPYPGEAPAVIALLGEHVTAALVNYVAAAEQIKAGKLRALATPSRTRIEPLPDAPTVAESGYKNYEMNVWNGLFAPANTPKELVSQLAGWFTAAMQMPDVRAKLVAEGSSQLGCAALILPRCFGSNMTNTAASFANQTSRPSEARRQLRVSCGHLGPLSEAGKLL